ncbi:MAG: TlpA family protein disulfide reductase [Flavobacteriales bacterium]|nr:TlpA family protein disulfide reductase [Flavobacteriales bacterium]
MRIAIAITLCILCHASLAQQMEIRVTAKAFAGQPILLYRYADLFTLRASRLGSPLIGDDGRATLRASIEGTAKLRLRVGAVFAAMFARHGSRYDVDLQPPPMGTARSLSGSARTTLIFRELDHLDPNALTSDLNMRLDAFISEDLATDQAAGMQAIAVQRKAAAPDSAQRPATLFVMPTWSKQRVDSFEQKVRHFYRDVKDPWFDRYLHNSFAGLRHGPRVNEEELFNDWIKGRPITYDDPELVRLLRSFYNEHLLLAQRYSAADLQRAYALGNADSLKAVLARNDFLRDDDRRCELVMIDLLHQQFNGKIVVKPGALAMLKQVAEQSSYAEHRLIAANMVWDLTAMHVGERLPAMRLEDMRGKETVLDSLLEGPVCVVLTASWCTYCDQELQALEKLHEEFGAYVRVIAISLDQDADKFRAYLKAHPSMRFNWFRATAEQELRDDLRVKSLPTFYLLNDGVLAHSPAPLPSRGLGAQFNQAKVAVEKGARIKVWDD